MPTLIREPKALEIDTLTIQESVMYSVGDFTDAVVDTLTENLVTLAKDCRSFLYHGDRFVCPCCKRQFRKLLPFGVVTRHNARCPHCGSLERHRLLWMYLKERTDFFTGTHKVLHFAPEPVFQHEFMNMKNLDYVTADLFEPDVMVKVDITDIPFRDNTFDVILCNHVLEHVPDDRQAMRELYRVLKPGGWAILQSPLETDRAFTFEDPSIVTPEDRELFFGQFDHVRIYGLDYLDRLQSAGFNVVLDDYVRHLLPWQVEKYRLQSDEDIYFCRK